MVEARTGMDAMAGANAEVALYRDGATKHDECPEAAVLTPI